MYMALLVVALIAYAVQGVLVGQLARRHDLPWVVTVRGLSLLGLMAPLTLLMAEGSWARVPGHLHWLAVACVGALLANLAQTYAIRHLPMAIAQAASQGLSALFTLALAAAVFGEIPRPAEIACVAAILACVGILGWISSRDTPRAPEARPLRGLLACVGFAVSMAGALVPLGMVSREVDPFFAAWAWEGGIGVAGLLLVGGRAVMQRGAAPTIPWGGVWRVALCSSPTLVGTGCYAYATTIGNLFVAGGVLAMMMVATAVLARILYQERLREAQWAWIGATCAGLVALAGVQGLR
ncbi:MAG: hypothetical protein RLZZ127_469 [Planctomycetota bacterium]|jgi:drug/metabolite transporter (DMT)-like permease